MKSEWHYIGESELGLTVGAEMPFAGVEIEHYVCRSRVPFFGQPRKGREGQEGVCTGRESIEALGHVYRRRRLVCSLPVSRKSSLGLFPRR